MNLFAVIGGTLVHAAIVRLDSRWHHARLGAGDGQGPRLQARRAAALARGAQVGPPEGALTEVFGTGTAAVISPVGELAFEGGKLVLNGGQPGPVSLKLFEEISSLQQGLKAGPLRVDAPGRLSRCPEPA